MDFEKDIQACIEVLKNGGLILYPTDTIWGIGCDATSEAAVKKIFQLKQRSEEKALIVLVAQEKEILKYTAQADLQVFDFLKTRQKPTTVIYQGAIGLADNLIGSDGSVAIRITGDEFCRHLIRRFRKPLVSTSANIAGRPSPKTFAEISDEIKNGVDYVVQHRQNDNEPAVPSSLIKWNKEGSVTVLRE